MLSFEIAIGKSAIFNQQSCKTDTTFLSNIDANAIQTCCIAYCFASATRKLNFANPQDYVLNVFLLHQCSWIIWILFKWVLMVKFTV